MTRNQPEPQKRSRWKLISVIVILVILAAVLAMNLSGWSVRPFGFTYKSHQPQ
jgi:hypothetical protein